MFAKPFDQITLQDIEELVNQRKERENNHLEYKRELGNSDRDKKEFLKDVSGFANATGGFLIIGVEEVDGVPERVCGMPKTVGNQKIDEWINNVLISNIDERLRYEIKIFDIGDNVLILIFIQESPKKPHMVTFDNRNIYYIRHNTSVTPATQSEVRDMFENSRKSRDKFEEFLKARNLFDHKTDTFGITEYSNLLANKYFSEVANIPFVLYSFIPRYLHDERINTISKEFSNWIYKNNKSFQPFKHVQLFSVNPVANLYGICFLSKTSSEIGESIKQYFEISNNGFFESGLSRNVIYTSQEGKPVFNLTAFVGYAWTLVYFAKEFYSQIDYYDEVVFQISIVNVRNITLCGFGRQNKDTRWAEPFSFYYENPPSSQHEKFKILDKFLVRELSEDFIKSLILRIAEKISRAFGEMVVKCFDDDGNFNIDTMNHFFH